MRVFLFQDKFAGLVKSGAKKQTIRLSARCKPGDDISLRRWSGKPYRSKQETLRNAVCIRVQELRIYEGPATETSEKLARADGFSSHADMQAWFKNTHGLPFEGCLIEWD